ncbi:MAG: efflux RND transporter periplasmic adaptor subunit [Planctomycetota bacterium]|nr:efflux RND transporter periplasmic adaptor subunit [Planctomycetota bacterium]MDA1250715.1 efflux RND transporter periplasmic adaptor subunit [Planctomycetota bacterium]
MRIAAFFISSILCLGAGYYVYDESLASVDSEPKQKKDEAVSVETVASQRCDLDERVELVGSLEAVNQVQIRSRIIGYLDRIPFEIGDSVEAEDIVVELNELTYLERVSKANQAHKVALAQQGAATARRDQIQLEVARLKELAADGVGTAQQQEDALSRLAVAQAEIGLEEARVSEASAEFDDARKALDELKIRSPISGVVAERTVEVGDLAKTEEVLMRIVNLKRIRTVVHVVERDYEKVRKGQEATIEVDSVPGRTFTGNVVARAPVVDPETRTARVIIDIENEEEVLKPGMHARVAIVASHRDDAQVIPISALQERNGRQFIFVSEADKVARRRYVTTGIRDGELVEVLSGIESDAMVITLGSRLVQDGSTIATTQADWDPVNSLAISESRPTAISAEAAD